MFMFVTLSCRKSLSENVFKKTACFFFFRISIRQKATLASGMCATRMHRPKNNFKLMKLLGSVEFPSGPGFRGFMVDHHLPIANVNGKLVSEKPSNLGKMSMFPRMGGGSNAFPCFTPSSVLFWKESEEVDRIRPGVAVRLRPVAPFFAAPP